METSIKIANFPHVTLIILGWSSCMDSKRYVVVGVKIIAGLNIFGLVRNIDFTSTQHNEYFQNDAL
jgi:hypothetical protein